MSKPDSEGTYRPGSEEVKNRPRWVPLEEMFVSMPENSIGRKLFSKFSDGLKERKRPETIFNQSLKALWPGSKSRMRDELEQRGIATLIALFRLQQDGLSSFSKRAQSSIVARLTDYLQSLRVTPHARLLQTVFARTQAPIPPQYEHELMEAVDKKLTFLIPRQQQVIKGRFGLDNGIPQTLDSLAKELGVAWSRPLQIERAALRNLRNPKTGTFLLTTLPEECFGRQLNPNAIFMRDLPRLETKIDDSAFSPATLRELKERGLYYWTGIHYLLWADLRERPFTPGANEEIKEVLKRAFEESQQDRAGLPPTGNVFVEGEDGSKRQPIGTEFFPGIYLTGQQFASIYDQPIENLYPLGLGGFGTRVCNTLKRSKIRTIGDLLSLSREELMLRNGIREKILYEVTEKLWKLLGFSEEALIEYALNHPESKKE